MTAVPATARQPADRKPKKAKKPNPLRDEALNSPVTFTFDGDEFTVVPTDASKLEFLAALEDEDFIPAIRALLGRDQATRLFKGRRVEDLGDFFDVMGQAVGLGNR